MANATPQSYANHARLDPGFHFVLLPLTFVAVILSIISLVRHPGLDTTLWLLLAIALFLTAGKARGYALKAQDRVIRLEERLRLSMLLPEADQAAHRGADRAATDRAAFCVGCRGTGASHARAERRPDQEADKNLYPILAR